jgi:hypothetical protein
MRLTLFVTAVLLGTCASTGCMMQRFYSPGPTVTYLWIPGIGEWPINDASAKQAQDKEATPPED